MLAVSFDHNRDHHGRQAFNRAGGRAAKKVGTNADQELDVTQDEYLDPRLPLLSEIEVVRALSRADPDAYVARGSLNPCMRSLFLLYITDRGEEIISDT